jgi:uncharacterized OsmC-like protein
MQTRIEFTGKRSFKIKIRGHEVMTDLSEKMGGDNTAPTPAELFVGSFGSCVGLYAARYLQTAELDPKGLAVDLDWEFDEKKTRVGQIRVSISVPNATLGARKNALLLAAGKCTLHNTLQNPPDIEFSVKER